MSDWPRYTVVVSKLRRDYTMVEAFKLVRAEHPDAALSEIGIMWSPHLGDTTTALVLDRDELGRIGMAP